ncbi:MAG TPA: DUF1080 domain-containing protein [Tepidisphaeraceae bacterium]|nr:DUF1080 domain-containing protein [Tepidisphaeraceae bacterium]
MHRLFAAAAGMVLALTCGAALAADRPLNQPPEGFTNLFDGKTLHGWRGRQQDYSPYAEAKLSKAELADKQALWNANMAQHWRVDAEKGEIVSDGHGVYLTTGKDYRDFDMWVDWLMVSHNGDSGVYLRAYPQVQIWDPSNAREIANGIQKGSGALWNNNNDNPGKWPLVKADNPVGQWNTFHIKMIGSRVWVWFNDKLTVDGQILDNYFDRTLPVLPIGPIELQTHGSEIRFRNVYIREIQNAEANAALDKLAGTQGYKSVFNGKDFTGWGGPVDEYEVHDGAIRCKPGKGGTIHTNEEFTDFEGKVEFKLPPAGNNGLAIRYPGTGDTAYVGMCELQILDDTAPEYKNLDPRQSCCSIYGVVPAHMGYLRPLGEWNFEHFIIKGHTIKVELNGNVVVNADVSKVHEFMAHNKHPGLMRTKGSFGFAGHTDPVEFRHVYIKPIE